MSLQTDMDGKNNVYVVECKAGKAGHITYWIDSIFYNKDDAEKKKKEILEYVENAHKEPCPFDESRVYYNLLTDEEEQLYSEWYYEKQFAEEFVECSVLTYNVK